MHGASRAERARPCDRDARARRRGAGGAPGTRVSARALGRHASARHAGDGADQPPAGADRRRADHRARRHDAGADPRTARRPAGGDGARAGDREPRPRCRRRHRRPRARDVRGPHRRGGSDRSRVRRRRPSVHTRTPGVGATRRRRAAGAGRDPGQPTGPDCAAVGLPVPPAVRRSPRRSVPEKRARVAHRSTGGHRAACLFADEVSIGVRTP